MSRSRGSIPEKARLAQETERAAHFASEKTDDMSRTHASPTETVPAPGRLSPDDLRAYIAVMRAGGCVDFATEGFRLTLHPTALTPTSVVGESPPALRAVEKQRKQSADEDEDIEYAHVP